MSEIDKNTGSDVLVTPGLKAFEQAVTDVKDYLQVVKQPLGIYIDSIPALAESNPGAISYYALAARNPVYSIGYINDLSSRLSDALAKVLDAQEPKVDDQIYFQTDILPTSVNNDTPNTARIGLSERIGKYSVRHTIALNDNQSSVSGYTKDIRHKVVADVYPDVYSASRGSYRQSQIVLASEKAERDLKKSLATRQKELVRLMSGMLMGKLIGW